MYQSCLISRFFFIFFCLFFMEIICLMTWFNTPHSLYFLNSCLICLNLPLKQDVICPNDQFNWLICNFLLFFLYLLHILRPVNISHFNGKPFSFVVGVCGGLKSVLNLCLTAWFWSVVKEFFRMPYRASLLQFVTIESVCYSLLGSQSKLNTLLFFHVFISALEFSLK